MERKTIDEIIELIPPLQHRYNFFSIDMPGKKDSEFNDPIIIFEKISKEKIQYLLSYDPATEEEKFHGMIAKLHLQFFVRLDSNIKHKGSQDISSNSHEPVK